MAAAGRARHRRRPSWLRLEPTTRSGYSLNSSRAMTARSPRHAPAAAGWTDGIAHLGTFLGPLLISNLFTWTAANRYYG